MSSKKPNSNPILTKAQEIKEAQEEMEQKKDETLHSPSEKTKEEVERLLSDNQNNLSIEEKTTYPEVAFLPSNKISKDGAKFRSEIKKALSQSYEDDTDL